METLSAINWAELRTLQTTPSPPHWEDQLLYFLLLDRFSDNQEAGITAGGTTPLYNDAADRGNAITNAADAAAWQSAGGTWAGGNLQGVLSKIPYLKGLGISTIWISPLLKQTAGDSYHGYGIQHYLQVDPHFGTDHDLKALVKEAHAQGIYVILDIILNHSGNVFSYDRNLYGTNPPGWYNFQTYQVSGFNDASGQPTIPFIKGGNPDLEEAIWPVEIQTPDTFSRQGKINNWDDPPQFLNGDFESLKDIHLGSGDAGNYQPSDALKQLCEAYKYWMIFADLDGFRIDTVKHMDQGAVRYIVSVFHEFAQSIGKDNFYLIGEITGGRANAVGVMDNTGLDAALGIDDLQNMLEYTVKGVGQPQDYFNLFRNSILVGKDSHTWFNNKVVTMIDDHDKVCKGDDKRRFCSFGGTPHIFNAMAFNITTMGIPCVYYGTEQAFDGEGHQQDRYIREAMFGGAFGAFRSKERHCFDMQHPVYKEFASLAAVRSQYITLRRGRQYLRQISGDGQSFGYPVKIGEGAIQSVIAWSRIMDTQELIVAFSNDLHNTLQTWVTIDNDLNQAGDVLTCIYSSKGPLPDAVVMPRNGKAIQLNLPPGGFVVYGKK
jgi:glycosidase